MRRIAQSLCVCVACVAVLLCGVALSFPISAAGCVQPSFQRVCVGSGVYIGNGFMLTNQHVAELLSDRDSFLVPAWRHLWHTSDAGVQKVIYLNRDIDLGIVKLQPSLLNIARVATPCLSTRSLYRGEKLRVTGDVGGVFPPVSATLAVSDPQPHMRLDPEPPKPGVSRYSAMSIVATLSAQQASLVGHGSSGGPALNSQGELVGLVWTGRPLEDGSAEVLITPASVWLQNLRSSGLSKDDLRFILGTQCEVDGKRPADGALRQR